MLVGDGDGRRENFKVDSDATPPPANCNLSDCPSADNFHGTVDAGISVCSKIVTEYGS